MTEAERKTIQNALDNLKAADVEENFLRIRGTDDLDEEQVVERAEKHEFIQKARKDAITGLEDLLRGER